MDLSFEQVSKALTYDQKTGVFRWKISPARNVRAGDEAGTNKARRSSSGRKQAYRYIRLHDVEMPAARVAWLLTTGEWPDQYVMAIDGDPLNLRLSNLKLGGAYEKKTLPTKRELSFEEASEILDYDPATGALTWKISPARHIKAGSPAGASANKKKWTDRNGIARCYSFISFGEFQGPACRVAWLLGHGEWPKGNVIFADGDASNLCLSNLRLRDESLYQDPIGPRGAGLRRMSKTAMRRYSLRRYYGLTPEAYAEKLKAQNGVCAICGEPEKSFDRYGNLRELQVDHDHEDNHVRDLLCFGCNNGLGSFKDNPERLDSAAAYVRSHRKSIRNSRSSDRPIATVDVAEAQHPTP